MLLQKSSTQNSIEKLQIANNEIKSESLVTLLGVTIDNRLTFDEHISKLCKKASMQLNAIQRLSKYIGPRELEVMLNSFIYSNFNYCPLVWHFSSNKSLEKIEKIHQRCLRLVLNDYDSDYKTLLEKSSKDTMKLRRIKALAIEIYKTINDLNPSFMKNIFTSKTNAKVRPYNLQVKSRKSEKYGNKSLMALGPKIWNALPEQVKKETSFTKFKEYIKSWSGPICKCTICKSL